MMQIRENGGATNPIKDVLSAGIVDAVILRKDKLKLAGLIPIITDVAGLDMTTKEIKWNVYEGDGKSLITDMIPNTVPALTTSAERKEALMKWISFGIEITAEKKAMFQAGKTKFSDDTAQAVRVVERDEELFLKESLDKVDEKYGVNVSSASSHWDSLTGVALIKEIRKHKNAHTKGERFEAKSLWLDEELYNVLKEPFSETVPKSYLQILMEDKDFGSIISVPNLGCAFIVDDSPENFGRVVETVLRLEGPFSVERIEKYVLEEHTSELIVKQPGSITKIEGAM